MYPSTSRWRSAIDAFSESVEHLADRGEHLSDSSLTSVWAHVSPAAWVMKPYVNARICSFSASE